MITTVCYAILAISAGLWISSLLLLKRCLGHIAEARRILGQAQELIKEFE